jgi:hypothetical protein
MTDPEPLSRHHHEPNAPVQKPYRLILGEQYSTVIKSLIQNRE